MKRPISTILCMSIIFFLSACSHNLQSPTQEIYTLVQNGTPLQEISNQNLSLPNDIYNGQVLKYFRIGDVLLALVLRSSMNIGLSLPTVNTETTFGWILIARTWATQWSKLIEIKDSNIDISLKNNPHYLTLDEQKRLLLTVVDHNGGWSGEGIMKVFILSPKGERILQSCYYFGTNLDSNGIDTIEKYLAYSIDFATHTPEPITSCQNTVAISYL